jgi:ABC-type polysaccharide/polyol phosphate export permease
MTQTQFRLRYRQSFAGITWALLPTLATLGVGILVFHRMVGIGGSGASYAVSTLAALIPWTFFNNSLSVGIPSISGAGPIITRVPFPRATYPLSLTGLSLLDLGVASLLFAGFALVSGAGLPVTATWLPALVAIEIVLVSGITLLMSALNIFARDIRLAVPLVLQLWLFVTPVMYPLSSVPPGLRSWYLLNPLTGLIESFRRTLAYGQAPSFSLLWPAAVGSVTLFVAGSWYFTRMEGRFADVV